MTTTKHARVLILGSGPAGYTAAVYAARANLQPMLITGIAQGGQLMTTTDVDNWPADAAGRTGAGADAALLGACRALQDRDRLRPHPHGRSVVGVRSRSPATAAPTPATALIIATGASAKYLGLPSETAFMGRGVSGARPATASSTVTRSCCVVGGGNTAVEEALYLSNIASKVYPGASARQVQGRADPGGQADGEGPRRQDRTQDLPTLDEVLGDDSGVTGIRIRSTWTAAAPRTST
jgi:thioredoxin reductase (NADPH)